MNTIVKIIRINNKIIANNIWLANYKCKDKSGFYVCKKIFKCGKCKNFVPPYSTNKKLTSCINCADFAIPNCRHSFYLYSSRLYMCWNCKKVDCECKFMITHNNVHHEAYCKKCKIEHNND